MAGMGAAPILATLASRPVLGKQPTSGSAQPSLGGSLAPNKHASAGRSPAEWVDTQVWPNPYYAIDQSGETDYAATLYHSPATGLAGAAFGGSTMLAVLQSACDGDRHGIGGYVAAALLNAREGLTPTLSEPMVRAMWNQFAECGYYEPIAGVHWDAGDIVRYIRTTIA
jgi:hypothetical protein